ncbi:efflux RND transporter permease subunit [Methylocystis sp. L43]|jgi:Cu(I)/Ag(I) efflux system membrane protein CusA/SilA|uniref:efflux RND transporter permease subunit n=1 Tax=unclassified Methylocystis TaxID=2625913 RepID=UPI0018C2000C|nr:MULTISPECIES: CusA/CzcA family heavy metal efflux RND transporter [unclassified Methylocystis]MBG0796300.1 efflux RND transporter permease subunit [Methylocystis sp. L43]MBG0804247.1 efflux RND transporter permease subunit [Methylocystis sp. H15]
MIARIIEFSARNAFLVLLLVVAILGGGLWAVLKTPLDALPDLSDVQVIVSTQWEDRSPNIIEDQITYPIVTQLLSTSHVKAVRASSFYGESLVYVIFEDGTDLYWARTRVLEYLSGMAGKLPPGVSPKLGPDATGVGWAFEYALIDKTGKHSLADLRTLQDWQVQYQIRAVPGVAEVAAVGGLVKQYQVTIDPDKLLAYRIPINKVVEQVRRSNQEVGGRVLEFTGKEYMVRGRGYIQKPADIENVAVGAQSDGTPILVRDVGFVQIGPDIRRGVADLNGMGDVAGGIVVVRYGVSVYDVLNRVKEVIKDTVQPSLPEGVELVVTYDRSELIKHSVETLREKLIEEGIIVSLVCLVFLFHLRSALVAIITLPLAVLMALVAMQWIGLTSNIMSLGGIAIAIGAMVDAAIVMIENAHKHIEREQAKPPEERRPRLEVVIEAGREVGPSLFFSLLIITVSFLPVFALQDQEGRLFKPLAYTKSFSMFFAAILSITVTPFLMVLLIRGKLPPEEANPINRFLIWIYQPVAKLALKFRYAMVIVALLAIAAIVPIYASLGSEFMPPLWEESILFMPATLPGSSIQTMKQTIQEQDKILMDFPEVATVFAKAGRANSATDPAPLEMVETVISLKPEDQWRKGMTSEKLIGEMNQALKTNIPGFSNSWTMPIKARIDMLSTGIRTPIGVKVFGPDLAEIGRILTQVEAAVSSVPGTRSAFAERVSQGYYLDFDIDRAAIARYGLSVMDVQDVIVAAVGGANLTQTIEGRQRFPVNVRYGRELRDDLGKLRRVLVATPTGTQVPLEELAELRFVDGPTLIKSEAAQLVGYVYVDVAGRDTGGYMDDARKAVAEMVKLPPGYRLEWSGSFEGMQRAGRMLKYVIPITLALIAVLLYLNARSLPKVLIVLTAVPFSLVGAFLLLWLLGYHLSVAVWVGIIALAGVDAETGMVMLLYLDVAFERWKREGRMNSIGELEGAVMEGAVQRVRPKMMTVLAILMGLLPIMWGSGTGSDVMKRIAAPMVGGVVTSFILELLIYPAIYVLWKWWSDVRHAHAAVK